MSKKHSDFCVTNWVRDSDDPAIKELRQAIHTLFVAISETGFLQKEMIMKGGILLAVKFKSTRYTRDVDFSTSSEYADFDEKRFLKELSGGLAVAVEKLDYGLDCRIQSQEVRPAKDDASFKTLTLKIGYAYKGSKKHKSLNDGKCSTILKVDYSFYEYNRKIDLVELEDGKSIKVYSLADIVGEKYRAIIQQKVRNRERRQDAYDIFYLLSNAFLNDAGIKDMILESLIKKSTSRGVDVDKNSLDDREIMKRSKAYYKSLQQEIEGDLPDFDKCYGAVVSYYKSLPWGGVKQ
jgi:predicted nucleotidyltransferase component of viral defense system